MSTPNTAIPDVQNSADTRQIAINKVGIKSIRHPIKVQDKSTGVQHTIAMFNMYVGLPHNFKGTHMSRFVEILNSHEREISVENFPTMLRDMVAKLEAETGHIEMNFPYFINKTAPISGVQSLMDYDVTFIGDICHVSLPQGIAFITSRCTANKAVPSRMSLPANGILNARAIRSNSSSSACFKRKLRRFAKTHR